MDTTETLTSGEGGGRGVVTLEGVAPPAVLAPAVAAEATTPVGVLGGIKTELDAMMEGDASAAGEEAQAAALFAEGEKATAAGEEVRRALPRGEA